MFRKVKDLISFYDNQFLLSKVLNKSSAVKPSRVNPGSVGIDPISTFNKGDVTFYYIVDKLPTDLPIDFKQRLEHSLVGNVRLSFIMSNRLHTIDWSSVDMQRRLRALEHIRSTRDDTSAYKLHEQAERIKGTTAVEDSLEYLADASITRGRNLIRADMVMVLTGERGDAFDYSVSNLNVTARNMGIGLKRVTYILPEYISYTSPLNGQYIAPVASEIPEFVITDEILAQMFSYEQGGASTGGIYCGTDIHSGYPVPVKVKEKGDEAEIWLVTAETGGGKSFFVKWLILALLGEGFNATIMDVEGFEYLPLGDFIASGGSKVQVINLGEGVGVNYFDPVEIHELTGIEEIDIEAKRMSESFTVAMLSAMLGEIGKGNPWISAAVKRIVNYAYTSWGVTEDSSTWHLSKGKSLGDIFKLIDEYPVGETPLEFQDALENIKFFLEDQLRSSLLGERITVGDIRDSDLLICSFGMAGKSEDMVDPTVMVMMQLTATLISYQRSIFSFMMGKMNMKVWEEFQRWGKFPGSENTIGVALTGGRKLGDFNLVITNDVKRLLDDDKFGLFGNITSFFLGAIIDSETREELCKRLTIPEFTVELDKIIEAAKLVVSDADKGDIDSADVMNPYTYSFVAGLKRSRFSVVRLDLPKRVIKTGIFDTGIVRDRAEINGEVGGL